MNRWLCVGLLVVSGCGEEEPAPLWLGAQPGAAGASAGASALAPAPLSSWTECGQLEPRPVELGGMPELIYGVSVSPDGKRFVTTTGHSSTGYEIAPHFAESRAVWAADTGLEWASEYSKDGTLVAISGDGRAVVDALTGVRGLYPAPSPGLMKGCFNAYFGFSSDHRLVAGGGWSYGVDVYDTESQLLLQTLPSAGCNASAAFSLDGSLLATSSGELYRTSDWGRISPAAVAPVQPSYDEVLTGVQFLGDTKRFVTSSCEVSSTVIGASPFECHNLLYSYEAEDELTTSALADTVSRPSFSSAGQWMLDARAIVGGGGVSKTLPPGLTAAAFVPNGDVIAGDAKGVLHRFCASQ